MQETFVISASSDSDGEENSQRKQWKKEGSYKNFLQLCDDIFPDKLAESHKLKMKLNGMSKLLGDISD